MSTITPRKTDLGWIVELPPELAQALGAMPESLAVLHPKDGSLEVEILPPPSPELTERVRHIHEKYREAFEEMRRLGD